ncbi:hypothetical protein CNYM01_07966 [Colletotrichum nymphaeae SA-01]|uniref:Uncharacterized protein n=1 Tax=Colletotrichum nymphaeae SA-01 TaxID=1460502 RepID=A0A135SHC7_9PEZI|nr:hypothetical protein CNYM01_07966 [Colletotrichum nymphaeae SA-01]
MSQSGFVTPPSEEPHTSAPTNHLMGDSTAPRRRMLTRFPPPERKSRRSA